MQAWFRLLKARTLLLSSAAVVVVGLAPVLYLFGLIAWQFSTRLEAGSWVALPATLVFTDHAFAFIPRFDWGWSTNEVVAQILGKLHLGLIPALIGCGVIAAGISGLLRQRVLIRIHKERKKDRVRRIDDYRREASRTDAGDDRREPFIGADHFARNTDRRVA
jgi:hypothetical protein